jgi:hypothetical protein
MEVAGAEPHHLWDVALMIGLASLHLLISCSLWGFHVRFSSMMTLRNLWFFSRERVSVPNVIVLSLSFAWDLVKTIKQLFSVLMSSLAYCNQHIILVLVASNFWTHVSTLVDVVNIRRSSAYIVKKLFFGMCCSRSTVYSMKRIGLRTEPCGSPLMLFLV